jgi:hypothetical protein
MLFEVESIQKMVSISTSVLPPKIVTAIREIHDRGPEYESDLEFLESLHFPGIKARQMSIKDAQYKTFDWILEPKKYLDMDGTGHPNQPTEERQKPQAQVGAFANWLEKEDGIFWIHGKPGCGKSTLMKFICSNPKTESRLHLWASPKRLVIARYFFWRAGSSLQHTQQGLLRSLVFEMIRGSPDLLPVAKATLLEIDRFDSSNELWTKDQLLRTYKAIVNQPLATRFCFFIDGLDEYYDGERKPQHLVKTIRELDLSSDVKLCISSRPYPIFLEEFGRNQSAERVLKVEDYTRGDIHHYVEERFKATKNFIQLQEIDQNYADFVDEVSDRAQGVFLWVVLVVANLERGLESGDSLGRLRKRLNSYPPDLHEFFLQMLKNVDPEYRKQAMRTFEMVTSALHPLHAMLFWYLYIIDEDLRSTPIWKDVQPLRVSEVEARLTQLRRKLQAQSQGLLEIVEDGDHVDAFFKHKLDFIHRTVRDFLSTSEEVKEQFRSELMGERRTTWVVACHSLHSLFQAAPFTIPYVVEEDFMKTVVKDLYYYASRARHCGDRSVSEEEATKLVDTGEASCRRRVQRFNEIFIKSQRHRMQQPHRLFLCLDAQYNFSDNLNKRIKTHGKSLKINRDGGRPVLDCALIEIPGEGPVQYSEEIVKVLLGNGAEATCVYQDNMTVWQRFVVHLAEGQAEARPWYRQTLVAILKLLLDRNEGVLNATVELDEGRKTAEAVLGQVLSGEEQARIPQLRKRGHGWFKSWRSR